MPFGWGDGGGGPTREMLARAARLGDLEGSARVRDRDPDAFFEKAHAEYPDAPVWVGELYLELHRGTYTSQAKTKQGNRRSEQLLREAELWAPRPRCRTGHPYPYEALDRIWKTVLLHQFHDILPGSSIAWVHREAGRPTRRSRPSWKRSSRPRRRRWPATGGGHRGGLQLRAARPRRGRRRGRAPGWPSRCPWPRPAARGGGGYVLANGLLRVEIDDRGLLVSVFDLAADREVIAPGAAGNLLQIHPDLPANWDAWDVDDFYRRRSPTWSSSTRSTPSAGTGTAGTARRGAGGAPVRPVRCDPDRVARPGDRRVDIDTEVDWHETENFLKAAFPLDVHADRSAAETQFGHVYRATHTNTSWEAAKFEICAHRFVQVEEPGWGVAMVNDSTYGHDVTRTVRADGGSTTTVRLSLLRAPRFPDPETDQGIHRFRFALVPGADLGDAVREGCRINMPERRVPGDAAVAPLVRSTTTPWWSRRSSWPTTAAATSSCVSTRRWAPAPGPGWSWASTPPRSS